MKNNLQRYFAISKKNNEFILDEKDIRHITKVMRMKAKDKIEVIYEEKLYICYIDFIKENIFIKIEEEKQELQKILPITLVVPIVKEQKMDLILQKSTELGVNKIIPVFTDRTLVKLNEKDYVKKITRWEKIVKEASEQAKRNTVPTILDIKKLIEIDVVDELKIVCSTKEKSTNLAKIFSNSLKCDSICVVIGPEGGLTSIEEKILNEKGFKSVSLGNRILRVETVPIFVLSILNYIYMER